MSGGVRHENDSFRLLSACLGACALGAAQSAYHATITGEVVPGDGSGSCWQPAATAALYAHRWSRAVVVADPVR